MPFQLNPSKPPIWRGENDLALGIGSDAQKLSEVSLQQEQLIQLLFKPIPNNHLLQVGEKLGLDNSETQTLIELLRPSLLIDDDTVSGKSLDLRFAEIMRISFETNTLPEVILAKRSSTQIHVAKLDRTGLLMIRALAETGFREFVTRDYETVSREDLGELGYPDQFLGISKLSAAREILSRHQNELRIQHESKASVSSISVISAHHQVNPADYRKLTMPYVAIEFGIESVRVSPVIVRGISACLGCRDLWLSEDNSNWTADSIQLALRGDQLDDAAAVLIAVSLATKNIGRFVDINDFGNGFQVYGRAGEFRGTEFQFHPLCQCTKPAPEPK